MHLGISSSVSTFLTLLLRFKLCFPYVYPTGATPLYPLALLAHLLRISLYLLNVYILVTTNKVICTVLRSKKFFEKSRFSAFTFCPTQMNVTRANISVQFAEVLGVITPVGTETTVGWTRRNYDWITDRGKKYFSSLQCLIITHGDSCTSDKSANCF